MPAVRARAMPVLHPCADDGWRMPDVLWERIGPLLPARNPHPFGCHRPRVDDRRAMEALFFVLRTGCPWHALNATSICASSSAHRRVQAWGAADGFVAVWEQGLVDYDAFQGLAWEWLALDGAMTQAPLGGGQGGQEAHGPRDNGHPAQRPHRRQRRAPRLGGGRRPPP
jgi:transposase